MAEHISTGKLGEDIACMFLVKHGYSIVERNYLRKWGEIDIIAKKSKKLYFIEVKSVSRESLDPNDLDQESLIRPEENVHWGKLKKLSRAIQSYLAEKKLKDTVWQFDILAVYINKGQKTASVRHVKDIIIS